MSCVWFNAEVVPKAPNTPFTEAEDHIPENVNGWFELHRDGKYWGWVCLNSKTGKIVFGEPG